MEIAAIIFFAAFGIGLAVLFCNICFSKPEDCDVDAPRGETTSSAINVEFDDMEPFIVRIQAEASTLNEYGPVRAYRDPHQEQRINAEYGITPDYGKMDRLFMHKFTQDRVSRIIVECQIAQRRMVPRG